MSTSSTALTARTRGSGVPLLVLAGVAWGTGGLLGSVLGRTTGLSPLAVAAYRLGLGGLLVGAALVGAALVGRSAWPRIGLRGHRRAAWCRVGTVGVLAAGFQGCYFTAVALTSVGLATLITIGTAPLVVTVVEAMRGRVRPGSAGTVVLALVGLGLLVGLPTAAADPLAATLGAAAAVLSGTGFAVMTLLGARPVPGLDPAMTTAAAFVLGGLLLVGPAAATGGVAVPATAAGVGLLALFAVVPTALAYTAYFHGLRAAVAPGTAAVLALLEPLTAAALAAVVLGERLGASGIVGALVLALAVLRAARPRPCPGAQTSRSEPGCRSSPSSSDSGPASACHMETCGCSEAAEIRDMSSCGRCAGGAAGRAAPELVPIVRALSPRNRAR